MTDKRQRTALTLAEQKLKVRYAVSDDAISLSGVPLLFLLTHSCSHDQSIYLFVFLPLL
jgi:hypothetical protein